MSSPDPEKPIQELQERLRRTEEALRSSEERFRNIVDTSLSGILILQKGRFVFANARLAEITGYEGPEELLGRPLREFVHPEDREWILRRAERRERGEQEPEHYEFRGLRKDGSSTWLEVNAALTRFDSRPAIVGTVHDISDRKEAERALRESEEKYRLLAENITDVIFIQDMDLNLTYVSSSVERLSGYTVDEVLQMGMEDLLTPDSFREAVGSFREYMAQVRAGENPSEPPLMEYEYVKKDGSTIWGELKPTLLRGENGEVTGILGVLRDVTDRKRAQREILVKDKALDSSINAVAITDISGRLAYVNPSFVKLWGYESPAEILGRPTVEFWQSRKTLSEIERALREKGGWIGEMIGRRKDGSEFILQAAASQVAGESGRPEWLLGFFIDITEQKAAEKALKESEQSLRLQKRYLEDANTALKVLLEHRESEKREIGEKIANGLQRLVYPYIEKIEQSFPRGSRTYLEILRRNLEEVSAPHRGSLDSKYSALTATEIEVAELIRHGKTGKEIAALLNISPDGVAFHRKSIRRKLGLRHKKVNLRTHLQSITQKR